MTGPSSPTTSADDHARRKRDRESDASSQLPTTPSETLPAKKNRLELGDGPEGNDFAAFDRENPNGSNAQAVRHISQKVNELSWEERQKLGQSPTLPDSNHGENATGSETPAIGTEDNTAGANAQAGTETETPTSPNAPAAPAATSSTKGTAFGAGAAKTMRSQLSFNAFASTSNPFSNKVTGPSIFDSASSKVSTPSKSSSEPQDEEAKESSDLKDVPEDKASKAPEASASKSTSAFASSSAVSSSGLGASMKKTPQLSFNAFSSASSPFSSGRFSATTGSAFGGASSKASAFSQPSSSQKEETGQTSWLSPANAQQDSKAGPEGSASTEASSSDAGDDPADDVRSDNIIPFQRRADEDSSAVKATDRTTGEESEKTIFSTRAKLYEMQEGGDWKERGLGTFKCNVPNEAVGGLFGAGRGASGPGTGKRRSAARLLMRTDGVLRVILNVTLFPGMSITHAQERFVRFGVYEDGKLVNLALKVSQNKVAEELYETIQSRIPPPQYSEQKAEAERAGKSSTGSAASQSGSSQ
ncbi:hypothetical protein OC846_002382 [Tilletia horrida]|uniref:RanBD1 domain-containing protein n=1 Tax=Tilletia horrida TaxID=155126 RepID=A0AAN6JS67_9BASI|nr:hypothetical protein OC845_002605 [Tilletia horrida]KAK0553724.1 hypothetical protein OC846_002382 [Tilletia horrida]KAK0567650.1 hypothetical protein OC861_002605 [Tilletia horrida]